jgi:hypothetical protein
MQTILPNQNHQVSVFLDDQQEDCLVSDPKMVVERKNVHTSVIMYREKKYIIIITL